MVCRTNDTLHITSNKIAGEEFNQDDGKFRSIKKETISGENFENLVEEGFPRRVSTTASPRARDRPPWSCAGCKSGNWNAESTNGKLEKCR